MRESPKGAGYIGAIESIIEAHKVYLALSGAPLVALIAQLWWIQTTESVFVKAIITLAVVCLLFSGAVSIFMLDLARSYLAKVKLESDHAEAVDSPYLRYLLELYRGSVGDLTEDGLTNLARKFTHPLVYAMLLGWGLLILALFVTIWSTDAR
jgi:hypothetical protein